MLGAKCRYGVPSSCAISSPAPPCRRSGRAASDRRTGSRTRESLRAQIGDHAADVGVELGIRRPAVPARRSRRRCCGGCRSSPAPRARRRGSPPRAAPRLLSRTFSPALRRDPQLVRPRRRRRRTSHDVAELADHVGHRRSVEHRHVHRLGSVHLEPRDRGIVCRDRRPRGATCRGARPSRARRASTASGSTSCWSPLTKNCGSPTSGTRPMPCSVTNSRNAPRRGDPWWYCSPKAWKRLRVAAHRQRDRLHTVDPVDLGAARASSRPRLHLARPSARAAGPARELRLDDDRVAVLPRRDQTVDRERLLSAALEDPDRGRAAEGLGEAPRDDPRDVRRREERARHATERRRRSVRPRRSCRSTARTSAAGRTSWRRCTRPWSLRIPEER